MKKGERWRDLEGISKERIMDRKEKNIKDIKEIEKKRMSSIYLNLS